MSDVGTAKNLSEGGMNGWLAGIVAVLAAVLVGMIVNFLSGVIITEFHAPAFIVTLAMMQAGRGVCYIYTGGTPYLQYWKYFKTWSGREFRGFYHILVIIIVLSYYRNMGDSEHGPDLEDHIYAVGGNPEAAKASGKISAKKTIIEAYIIHGAFVVSCRCALYDKIKFRSACRGCWSGV